MGGFILVLCIMKIKLKVILWYLDLSVIEPEVELSAEIKAKGLKIKSSKAQKLKNHFFLEFSLCVKKQQSKIYSYSNEQPKGIQHKGVKMKEWMKEKILYFGFWII